MSKRFQECNWVEKLWRYRHYVYIPFRFIRVIILKSLDPDKEENLNSKTIWHILIGDAQIKMNWVWTSDEVFREIKQRGDGKDEII